MTVGHHLGDAASAFVDGELTADRAALVRAHLPACRPCADEVAAVRRLRRTLAGSDVPDMPEHLGDALRSLPGGGARAGSWTDELPRPRSARPVVVPVAATLVVGACLLVAVPFVASTVTPDAPVARLATIEQDLVLRLVGTAGEDGPAAPGEREDATVGPEVDDGPGR